MHRSTFKPRSRVATTLAVAALGITMLSPIAAPTMARTHDVARLDLPAAVPSTAAITELGFTDFTWSYMDASTADDYFLDTGDDPDYTKAWQKTGYVAGFEKAWAPEESRTNPNADGDMTLVFGAVYQFETEDGASDAMALVNDGDASTMPADYQEHEIDLGDESSYSSFSFDGNGDVPIHSISVREGALIGEVSIMVGTDLELDAEEQIEAAQALATLIDDGMQDVNAGNTPNLGQLAPVYDDGGLLDFNDYLYRDGTLIELYPGETAATAQGREQGYVDSNATAVYRVIQPIIANTDDVPHYGVSTTITSFDSSRDAKAWLKDRPETLANASGVIEVEEVELDADLLPEDLDASDVSVFTYTQDFGDDEPYYKIQINVRVGEIGFTTYLESAVATPSEDALIAATSDVLTAIDAEGAPAVMQVPAAVQDDADALAKKQ